MKAKYKRIPLLFLLLTLFFTTLTACNLFGGDAEELPKTEDGYTALRDPFGDSLNQWSLARPFAARSGESAYWPADIYVTNDRRSASVYPIAAGRVVHIGPVSSQESWRGQYVIIEHEGNFRLPASNGVNVYTAASATLPGELEVGSVDPLVSAADLFTTDEKTSHRFGSEAEYTLEETTATTIFSVYKNLTELNVREGQVLSNHSQALGRLAVAPTESDYVPTLELEIRYFGNRELSEAAYNYVLGPSGDGSFGDINQMLDFGYLEATSVIQANLDHTYYEEADLTPPDSEQITQTPATTEGTDLTETTEPEPTPEETTEPEPTAVPDPQPGTNEEIDAVVHYLKEVNNYMASVDTPTIPNFSSVEGIDENWLFNRFLRTALDASGNNGEISLEEIDVFVQELIHPDIQLNPDNFSDHPNWNESTQRYELPNTGFVEPYNANDIVISELTRIGDRFEAVVYEVAFEPLIQERSDRNFGLISSNGRYVGYFDHPQFDIMSGNLGATYRYPLFDDSGSLDSYLYTLEVNEDGRFHLLSKETIQGSDSFRESRPSMDAIQVESSLVVNTGGQRLRIRSGPTLDSSELGFIGENSRVVKVGPHTNGFFLIFDTAVSDPQPTGYASGQYLSP